jgi:hypothetical protein
MEQLSQHLGFLPDYAIGPATAVITLFIGWVFAIFVRAVVAGAINRTGLGKQAKTTGGNIGKSIGKALYWIILLIALLLALGQFDALKEPLSPLSDMMSGILGYGKNILGAVLLFVIGSVVAKVGKEATQSSLEAVQVDSFAVKFGLKDEQSTSTNIAKSLGGLVSALILIGFGIAAIDALGIESISEPISGMLETVLGYIPQIFGAAIILGVAVFIGKFVSNLAKNTLPALGVDNSLKTVASLDGEGPNFVPSHIIATVAFVGIVLMGLTAAMKALGIPELTNVFNTLLEVGGRVVLGAIIIGAGLFIANFVSKIVTQTSGDLAGTIIKYATIVIVTFMGLAQMELGEEIVNTAFQYGLGAAAVAGGIGGAIAFGVGGRAWAAAKLEKWFPNKKQTTRK